MEGDVLEKDEEILQNNRLTLLYKDKKRWLYAALFLLPSIVLFALFPYLLTRSRVEERTGLDVILPVLWVLLSVAGAFLQLLEIRLSQKIRKIISLALLFVFPFLCMAAVEYINETTVFSSSQRIRILANYICFLMIFAVLYCLFRHTFLTCLIGFCISFLFAVANYFVIIFRSSPVLPWDIQSMGTAMDVAERYDFSITDSIALVMVVMLFLLSVISRIQPNDKTYSLAWRIKERMISAVLAIGLYVCIFPVDILSSLKISVYPWNQIASSRNTGMLAGFFANIQFMMVEKPDGYGPESMEKLKEQINRLEAPSLLAEPKKKPTIIAVMCESMTDVLTTNSNLKLSQDNMPFIHSLQQKTENIISGTAYSSVFAGSTCDSEYEFLTGNSMSFFPIGSKPYQQYVRTPQNSLVSTLKDYGYQTLAIHPANASNWQRDTAYKNLGFDEFVDFYSFQTEKIGERGYTNDESCYNEVIHKYEQRDKTQPLFTFLITIANHGGFEMENYPAAVEVMSGEGDFSDANQYLTSTLSSDKAFEKMIRYFEKEKEPVVILFFGDHWPFAGDNHQMGELLGSPDFPDLSKEELMKRQEVPYLIWANYEMEQPEIEETSLNYLSGLLMRAAGLEGTPFQKYLHYLHQSLPVITGVGKIDRSGAVYSPEEQTPYQDLMQEYNMLQYNNVFDSANRLQELFTISDNN